MPVPRHFANILDPRRFATSRGVDSPCPDIATAVRAVMLVAAIVFGAMAPSPARAADDDVFTVGNVQVDRSAESAAAARDLALADGQAAAFRRLVARLVPRGDLASVPAPAADGIAQLVQDFQVDQEKTSSVRYIAVLKVRFRADAVQRLLRTANVPFAVTPSKPLVVLPVYRKAGALLLWDRINPWLETWRALPPPDGLVPLAVPEGDLADIADISAEQALAENDARVAAIARRHGAIGGLLAYAVLGSPAANGTPTVEVTVSRIGTRAPERTLVQSVAGKAGENEDSLLARAAIAVRIDMEETWKRENLLRFGEHNRLVAVVPLAGIGDWVRLRRALAGIAFVESSDLLQLSRDEATVRLSYLGDEDQLALALAQHDLELSRGPLSWVLRARTAANPDPTATPARQ